MKFLFNLLKSTTDKNIIYLLIIQVTFLIIMLFMNSSAFYSIANLQSMSYQMPLLGLLTLSMAICMLTGGINLSIIATTNACCLVMASIIMLDPTNFPMILLGLFSGMVCALLIGILNGFLISYIGVSPILTTLGMMTLISGLNLLISGGTVISGFPESILLIGNGTLLGIPIPLILFIVFAVLLWALLEKTPLGKIIYMMGSNEKATHFSGINTQKAIIYVYIISSLLCWIAAILMMSKFNSAKAGYGESYLLIAILASVLGGINPDGGFGRILGIVLALIVLQTIESGLNLLGISSYLTMSLWGIILLLFIYLQKIKIKF